MLVRIVVVLSPETRTSLRLRPLRTASNRRTSMNHRFPEQVEDQDIRLVPGSIFLNSKDFVRTMRPIGVQRQSPRWRLRREHDPAGISAVRIYLRKTSTPKQEPSLAGLSHRMSPAVSPETPNTIAGEDLANLGSRSDVQEGDLRLLARAPMALEVPQAGGPRSGAVRTDSSPREVCRTDHARHATALSANCEDGHAQQVRAPHALAGDRCRGGRQRVAFRTRNDLSLRRENVFLRALDAVVRTGHAPPGAYVPIRAPISPREPFVRRRLQGRHGSKEAALYPAEHAGRGVARIRTGWHAPIAAPAFGLFAHQVDAGSAMTRRRNVTSGQSPMDY